MNEFEFEEISIEEEIIFESGSEEIPSTIVDKILYADDWARGYLNGQLVVSFEGVTDINAIELYNENGERVIPTPAPPEPNLVSLQSMLEISFVALAENEMIDDEHIKEHANLFVQWDEHFTGKRGTIVLDGGILFRSLHDVGVGQNTRPSETPSMWQRIGNPADEIHQWRQPLGAHDAYQTGDKVLFDGKTWVSTHDNNIWQPGVFGWEKAEGQ